MTPAEVATAIIVALGGATIIPRAIDGFKAWRSGKAREEKRANQSLLTRTINAEVRADHEADFRRRIEEWAGGLVYMLKQIGVPETQIPDKPARNERVNVP